MWTPAAAPRTVLFDFDGVLGRGDAFGQFVRARFRAAPWRLLLALVLALPMLPAWPLSRRRVIQMAVLALLLGCPEARYREAARRFGEALARQPRRFHRAGLTRLRQHMAAGDRVLVVTGCEETLVRSIFEGLGLGEVAVLASRLVPGPLGLRVALHNIGEHKLASLRAAGVEPPWDVAYGDSVHDLPMLREAREAVLVGGSPKWCKQVEQALGRPVTRMQWED